MRARALCMRASRVVRAPCRLSPWLRESVPWASSGGSMGTEPPPSPSEYAPPMPEWYAEEARAWAHRRRAGAAVQTQCRRRSDAVGRTVEMGGRGFRAECTFAQIKRGESPPTCAATSATWMPTWPGVRQAGSAPSVALARRLACAVRAPGPAAGQTLTVACEPSELNSKERASSMSRLPRHGAQTWEQQAGRSPGTPGVRAAGGHTCSHYPLRRRRGACSPPAHRSVRGGPRAVL